MSGETALHGRTIAHTAARRGPELTALLARAGARVLAVPAIRLVPLDTDADLLAATQACLEQPVDVLVATTAVGMRGWLEAAAGWGLDRPLRDRLAGAQVLARGPKVRGALRAAGLPESWSPPSETVEELTGYLLGQPLAGRRVAVQLHGDPLTALRAALERAGAQVLAVPVYRWLPPADPGPLRALVATVGAGELDALVFTSAPAVQALLQAATDVGGLPDLLAALRSRTRAACVGPVCAAPLTGLGLPVVLPERARLGDLARAVTAALLADVRS